MPARPLTILCAAVALSAAVAAAAADSAVSPTVAAPAKNWALPIFTNDGYRSMTLRGSEVQIINSDRIDVVDINITTYSGDAAARIDSILLSASASFFPRENRASGADSARLIRYRANGEIAAEITGDDWTYQEAGKKVSIRRHAHVVFQEQLTDILK